MKDFDVNIKHENLVGLWPDKPSHLQRVLLSAPAPVLIAENKPASSVRFSAIAALKNKHKKYFSATQRNRGSSDKQIPQAGSVQTQSSSVLQQRPQSSRVQSQKQIGMVKGTMSESTTNESVTTQSSDTFEASVESQEEMAAPIVVKEDV